MMPTCTTVACADAEGCCLVGGCVRRRYPDQFVTANTLNPASDLKKNAPALNGTLPRPSRDPRFIKRRRKELTR